MSINSNTYNILINKDMTIPKSAGVHVLFCPETKMTRYGKSLSGLLAHYAMNPKLTYYTSYNTFAHFSHHDTDVLGLNALWLDFDCVNNDIPTKIFGSVIPNILNLMEMPEPNHIIMSGNGYHFVWFFSQPRITHSPRFTKLWEKLERTIINKGQKACTNIFNTANICDNSVSNPSRLMRVVGSYNNKHGKHILVRRTPDYESREKYSFQWFINEYMPTLEHNKKSNDKKHKHFKKYIRSHKAYRYSHNKGTLNYGRYYDLKHLVEMRNGKVNGNRDNILFYIACQLAYVMPTNKIIKCVDSVNNLFSEPLPSQQIKDFENEIKHLDFKNYKLHTNQYLIKKLRITPNEQNNLALIKEARHSNKAVHHINHINRQNYLKHRNKKVIKLHKQGLSIRKIAKIIKISKSATNKIIKKKNKEKESKAKSKPLTLILKDKKWTPVSGVHTGQYTNNAINNIKNEKKDSNDIQVEGHTNKEIHYINHLIRKNNLKKRDKKVESLHIKGISNRKIAKKVHVSRRTVIRIINKVRTKMHRG